MEPVSVTTVRAGDCVQYDASAIAAFGDFLATHDWPELVDWQGLTAYRVSRLVRRHKQPMGMIFDDVGSTRGKTMPTVLYNVGADADDPML